jgi:hypothetical protein
MRASEVSIGNRARRHNDPVGVFAMLAHLFDENCEIRQPAAVIDFTYRSHPQQSLDEPLTRRYIADRRATRAMQASSNVSTMRESE